MTGKLTTTFFLLVFLILFFAGMSLVTGSQGGSQEMIGHQENFDPGLWQQPFSLYHFHIKG
jgi:hypothetical protein